MSIKKPQLDKLIADQEKDRRTKQVSPIFIDKIPDFDSFPGRTAREKTIWMLVQLKVSNKRICRIIKIDYYELKELLYKRGF